MANETYQPKYICVHCHTVTDGKYECLACGRSDGLIKIRKDETPQHAIDRTISNPDATQYFKAGTFIPKLLADELAKEYHFISVEGKDLFYYNEKECYYQKADIMVKGEIQARLGTDVRIKRISETLNYVNIEHARPAKELEQPANLIALKNGILDIETQEIEQHSPDYFFTGTLPVAYNPGSECPLIDKFLVDTVGEEAKTTFYELCGYCLYRKYDIQKAFMFVGSGSNGKSTTLNILKAFIGHENFSTTPLQNLGDNIFASSQLQYKLANIYADLPQRGLKDSGIFKMLTGGDTLNAEKKYRDPIPFVNYAKLVFSANKVPETNDDTDAFYRRWIIIPFNHRFEGENCDTKLSEKLTSESELSGLLNKALASLKVLLERGMFTANKSIDETKEAYTRASDPVGCFVLDEVVEDPTAWIVKDLLYAAFVQYCNSKKLPVCDKGSFSKRLSMALPLTDSQHVVDGKKGVRCWNGIRLGGGISGSEPRLGDF